MRTLDRVTSAFQRWWLWTTVTGDVVTQGQSGHGRRFAGVHGSTPYQRLATSAVSVALAKAAQAGFPRRGRPRPRKPGSSFGRRAPKVQRGPRRHPPYSLKGSVPEAPAYVSVRLCMDLGGVGIFEDLILKISSDAFFRVFGRDTFFGSPQSLTWPALDLRRGPA